MRFGVIGGGFGIDGHLAAISGVPGAEIVAVADSGSGRALSRLQDQSVYRASWFDLLSLNLDAVCVVTPPITHREIVLSLISNGKHVICEKPFGLNLLESREMADAVGSSGLKGAVNFQYRFEPGIQVLKEAINSRLNGNIHSVSCHWLTAGRRDPLSKWTWRNDDTQGGGVIGAFLSHLVDLLHWLTGAGVRSVEARSGVLVPFRPQVDGVLTEVTAEDWVKAQLELSNGVQVNCHVSNCHPVSLGMRLEFHGSSGALVYSHAPPFTADTQEVLFYWQREKPMLLFNAQTVSSGEAGDSRLPALKRLLGYFIKSINGIYVNDLPTFDDGWAVHNVLQSVRRSAESGTQARQLVM